jgi:hypothetical protein
MAANAYCMQHAVLLHKNRMSCFAHKPLLKGRKKVLPMQEAVDLGTAALQLPICQAGSKHTKQTCTPLPTATAYKPDTAHTLESS